MQGPAPPLGRAPRIPPCTLDLNPICWRRAPRPSASRAPRAARRAPRDPRPATRGPRPAPPTSAPSPRHRQPRMAGAPARPHWDEPPAESGKPLLAALGTASARPLSAGQGAGHGAWLQEAPASAAALPLGAARPPRPARIRALKGACVHQVWGLGRAGPPRGARGRGRWPARRGPGAARPGAAGGGRTRARGGQNSAAGPQAGGRPRPCRGAAPGSGGGARRGYVCLQGARGAGRGACARGLNRHGVQEAGAARGASWRQLAGPGANVRGRRPSKGGGGRQPPGGGGAGARGPARARAASRLARAGAGAGRHAVARWGVQLAGAGRLTRHAQGCSWRGRAASRVARAGAGAGRHAVALLIRHAGGHLLHVSAAVVEYLGAETASGWVGVWEGGGRRAGSTQGAKSRPPGAPEAARRCSVRPPRRRTSRNVSRSSSRPMKTMRLVRGSPSRHGRSGVPSNSMCTAWRVEGRGGSARGAGSEGTGPWSAAGWIERPAPQTRAPPASWPPRLCRPSPAPPTWNT
jgi:hypothetical protein